MIIALVAACAAFLGALAGLLVLRRKEQKRAASWAVYNARAFNQVRYMLVQMIAGQIQDACDGLPDLEEMLAPDPEEYPLGYASFRLIVDGWTPPTVQLVETTED